MNLVYFDLETQKLMTEVGGRENIDKLLLACAVTYSTARNDFKVYWERDVADLIQELKSADRVIGFNIRSFDYVVLRPYAPQERFNSLPTLDLMDEVYNKLGFRLGLDALANATLGSQKTADGILSVQWFKQGLLDKVREYCQADVAITRQLYEFGRDNRFVWYLDRQGQKQKLPVNWQAG
jgi:DEAD/DEAH box helicase domain-containing protein